MTFLVLLTTITVMKHLQLLFAFISITLSAVAYAEGEPIASPNTTAKWYQIEMIVFSQITEQGLGSEQWPLLSGALKVPAHAQTPSLLPSSQFRLLEAERALRQTPQYKILMHIAWNQ